MNHYREQEREGQRSGQEFSTLLEKEREKTKRQKTTVAARPEPLRLMGGLNQYNRKAMEVCFYLSSEADYRA
ncbi:MAG: hypothetical protein J1F02_07275 [Lachnospiraceae bacterium]|nr:hypothetical protein [Lachnospiraceae bacterium]